MIFTRTRLDGVVLVDPEPIEDERGSFARTWCARDFAAAGLDATIAQCNVSFNRKKGTVRGMHFQREPRAEPKLVSCTSGAIFDVVIDLRPASPTYRQWLGVELTGHNGRAIAVPRGFAHGFQTLEDDTRVFYQMGEFYSPELADGVRWNDPAFGIRWPLEVTALSPRDRSFPDHRP